MKKSQRGFSLIESLISAVILGIGLIGVTRMQLSMTASTQLARQRVDAVSMATSQLEVLRDAGACTPSTTTPAVATQGAVSYTMAVTCDVTNKVPTVRVTWIDAKNVTNNVQLHTFL